MEDQAPFSHNKIMFYGRSNSAKVSGWSRSDETRDRSIKEGGGPGRRSKTCSGRYESGRSQGVGVKGVKASFFLMKS